MPGKGGPEIEGLLSWRTAPWHPSARGKDEGVFLRKNRSRIDGETREDWTLCVSVRAKRGPRLQVVATLGTLDDDDLRDGWDQIEALRDGRQPGPCQPEPPDGTPQWSATGYGRWRIALARPSGCG